MTTQTPVTIIGGYLGAGKTTLVNQMLRQADGARLAVLVNEFGELPIDEDLIEAQSDELISIAGGCICCSFGSDLTAAMLKLGALIPRPDHIIIEASGVAMPGAIAHSISILPEFRVEGVCVLADSLNVRALSHDEYVGDTIHRQLSEADLLVLTKTDLVSRAALQLVQDWLADQWPAQRQVTSIEGHVPNAVLLGRFPADQSSRQGDHDDLGYESVVLRFEGPVDARALTRDLADRSSGVIRAKGYVNDLSGARALIQVVGQRAETTFPTTTGKPGVVCIGLAGRLNTNRLVNLAS